ncbi:DUF695 domain-containing protein [Hymenobacter gummosus]|uniref:DUF695 domain-containing protein n=1 Tax=Hymenobacter gummosus TaxID=1776032 RepID=A0A3S0IK69_9BACT|nr:DUF695 domain-containing protein [Hymenobacter gummosus]RTQ46242.1 DUF695 domain-containing protein [Hymenobacter gummosus]
MQTLPELAQRQQDLYSDFWQWFGANHQRFFDAVKRHDNLDEEFFDELSPQLDEVNPDYYFLVGMDDDTAELVITVDGAVQNIVFAEELVAAAPSLPGWRFVALKPAVGDSISLTMDGRAYNADNLSFYATTSSAYPDEIDLTFVYADWQPADEDAIRTGVLIFLDNYLGELSLATQIDETAVVGPAAATGELIPLSKLQDYLHWRQQEFVEKYEGLRRDTDEDTYAGFEAELENGNPLLAVFNTDLLNWDSTPSHPWIARLDFVYGDETTAKGMPDEAAYALLNELEDLIVQELPDFEGYLNIGRETGNGVRRLYLACKDFRKPSKVFYFLRQAYAEQFDISFDVYKDKYWRTFDRSRQV